MDCHTRIFDLLVWGLLSGELKPRAVMVFVLLDIVVWVGLSRLPNGVGFVACAVALSPPSCLGIGFENARARPMASSCEIGPAHLTQGTTASASACRHT